MDREFKYYLEKVTNRDDLTFEEAEESFDYITSGKISDVQIGGFLTALKTKRVTSDEVAGFATALRKKARNINPTVNGRLTDTAGTGGAPLKTINISTISAIVAAGAGIPVAKHGNRGITSVCGSADLIEALGAPIILTPDQVKEVIEEVGLGFLFAPVFHPAFKYAIVPRKQLETSTVFNMLGPLTNPAGAKAQVVGVYSKDLVDLLAGALQRLGTEKSLVVYGEGGLDELSTIGKTYVAEVSGNDQIKRYQIDPSEFDLPTSDPESLEGKKPNESAEIAIRILKGEKGPKMDSILLNSAAAIYVGGLANSIKEGIRLARDSIESGKALEKLNQFVERTNKFPKEK